MLNDRQELYFRAFAKRISDIGGDRYMDGYVLWGAAVGALSNVYNNEQASIPLKGDGNKFVAALTGMQTKVPGVLSAPLVRHKLTTDHTGCALLASPEMRACQRARDAGRVWTVADDHTAHATLDAALTQEIATSTGKIKGSWERLLTYSTYPGILYKHVRCPAVHDLTFDGVISQPVMPGISYTNYTSPKPHAPVRMCFEFSLLVDALTEIIDTAASA